MVQITKKSTVPNLQRGIAILEYLATLHHAATIAELTERLGFPSASVFRITQELAELGYLTRDPVTKQFSLTNKFLLLGQPQSRDRSLVEATLPAIRHLNRTTGETTQLCCLIDRDIVVIEQLVSKHPFKYSAELGARCPAFSCAPGKAIIAQLPEDEQNELITRINFKPFTSTTITTRKAFRDELQTIKKVGYALDRAEGLDGIHCVSAPVLDRNHYPVGAITIAAPASRLPESEFNSLGDLVAVATRKAEANYHQ